MTMNFLLGNEVDPGQVAQGQQIIMWTEGSACLEEVHWVHVNMP